jgi:lysophospholipase L1-like esterase
MTSIRLDAPIVADRVSRFAAALRLAPPQVVFLGDSITAAWPLRDRAFFVGRSGKGIGGNLTAQMLERFAADVLAQRPRVVHIMGGTNDLWRGEPGDGARTTLANLAAMADLARSVGVKVVLAAVPPVSPAAALSLRHPTLLPVLNEAIAALCRSASLVHVDYARVLADARGFIEPRFTTDGVHIAKAGYRAMRRQAEASIHTALAA